ncbi:MAG: SpoIIE family protein phosphatase [Bacteroidota bacterium]
MLRISLMFVGIFLLPLIGDIILGFHKALIVHSFAFAGLCSFCFLIKWQKNIERSIVYFFVFTLVLSMIIFMVINPTELDDIGICWTIFFLVLSSLLLRGKIRILFSCFLNWLPLLYVIINTKLGGILTIESIKQAGSENPPLFLMLIPISLTMYSVWTYTLTSEQAKKIITKQKHIINEKNKDIIDSIQYAKKLQDALLPPVDLINQSFPHNFIYYKPKDIVAGDFYWFEKYNDLVFVAAADCTGHGVPGAMVSVVCSGALTRTIKELNILQPDQILNKTRELVLETFAKNNTNVKDGMDISLLCIDHKNQKVSWSGANNPLWYTSPFEGGGQRPGDIVLIEIKADKQPIGQTDYPKPFTLHTIDYKKDTIFYLFTDGLADQFGGPKGKKYKYKQFSELLKGNSILDLTKQQEILNKSFEDWKGSLEQVDDVCVMGIKL